ncbi:CapA family protein [bacterium]|nr:CapA family protein [bacterium]
MKKYRFRFLLWTGIGSVITLFPLLSQIQPLHTDSCTVTVVGDIMIHDSQIESAWDDTLKQYDFTPSFRYIKDRLSAPDLTIGNLETTLPGRNYSGYPCFGAPDALIDALKKSGFDILSTANNHVCDKGRKVLIRTLDVLDSLGISHCGSYRNASEYQENRVLVIRCHQIDVVFLNYTYGTNGIPVPEDVHVNIIDRTAISEDMAIAHAIEPDIICVLMHFGAEYRRTPDDVQRNLVDFLFEEGADIVLGGHPHVVQPFTMMRTRDKYGRIKSRLVIYSMGNFLSNQKHPYTDSGILFSFTIRKTTLTPHLQPVSLENVSYSPIMIYKQPGEKGTTNVILPVEDFLTPNENLRLPAAVQKKITETEALYKNHLRTSMKETGKSVY